MRDIIMFFCSNTFKCVAKERSHQLDMSIPEYLKYLAAKDTEQMEINNKDRPINEFYKNILVKLTSLKTLNKQQ